MKILHIAQYRMPIRWTGPVSIPALPEFFSTETKNTLRLTKGDDKKDTGVRSRKARRGLMTRPHKTNRGTHGVPLLVLFIRQ